MNQHTKDTKFYPFRWLVYVVPVLYILIYIYIYIYIYIASCIALICVCIYIYLYRYVYTYTHTQIEAIHEAKRITRKQNLLYNVLLPANTPNKSVFLDTALVLQHEKQEKAGWRRLSSRNTLGTVCPKITTLLSGPVVTRSWQWTAWDKLRVEKSAVFSSSVTFLFPFVAL